jgi:hypothetical protein
MRPPFARPFARPLAATAVVMMAAVVVAAAGVLAGCTGHGNPPAGLDLSLTRPTERGRYVVELAPPDQPVRVNQIQSWRIALRNAAGEPVQGARIEVSGGMPQHGHGLPTQPRVSPDGEPGHYLLQGLKFSMSGWWEIRLSVRSPLGADDITFNTVLRPSS